MVLRNPKLFLWIALGGLLILSLAFEAQRPLGALSLNEGRTYDQAHDTGYIDWSGSIQYVYLTHRDGSWLPPEEGGMNCLSGCDEWVTRISRGGSVSGSFATSVGYFEVNLAMTHDDAAGHAVIHACSASVGFDAYVGPGTGLPGFVSMPVPVPAGCGSWSVTVSGGYVDFRTVDVGYNAPLPTSTFTSTPLPSPTPTFTRTPTPVATATLTSTPTATFTPTYTATFTATHTASPTPTPLPPEIHGSIVCDQWGEAGWCTGVESLELSASDPQGYLVSVSGDINGNPFTCGNTCSVPLPEGTGIAHYTVTSASGRAANGSSAWKRDSTPPLLTAIIPPVDGLNGWYISPVDISAAASDAISGIASVQASLDNNVNWTSLPIHLGDGVHPLILVARDMAGNESSAVDTLRIDTTPPHSKFVSPVAGDVIHGSMWIQGKSFDDTSGVVSGEFSQDGEIQWTPVSMNKEGGWSYSWDTEKIPNGEYSFMMRGRDGAGNVESAVRLHVSVDNQPPLVMLTNRWWIWESGRLRIAPNYFPVESVAMTISDPGNRWPALHMDFDPEKVPGSIAWDRRFANGILAPSGDYRVTVRACDVHEVCGSASGMIAIPLSSTFTATLAPSPTITFTITPHATLTPHPSMATPVTRFPASQEMSAPARPGTSVPLWQLFGLVGLFLAIASASLIDPRPDALSRLRESIHQIMNKDFVDIVKHDE